MLRGASSKVGKRGWRTREIGRDDGKMTMTMMVTMMTMITMITMMTMMTMAMAMMMM